MSSSRPTNFEVAILGAGMSGLCMAIQLQRAGIQDFVIVEKSSGIGGTWWDNRYPGAQVDIPAPAYSFSFAPNAHWTHRFADAPEIQRYQQRLAERHGLPARMRLGRAITAARFDATAGRWQLSLDNGDAISARFFVCSTGQLNIARWPDIPGLSDFSGRLLHSARWPQDCDLAGLRVGVIGTGSTAAQLVPALAKTAGSLKVFQRTPNWVLPRLDRRYNRLDRLMMRLPGYGRLSYKAWCWLLDLGRHGFEEGTLAHRAVVGTAGWHLRRQVADPALREALIPRYPLGCKRIIYSNDYYPALCLPTSELVTAGITRVTSSGLVTADGREHELDALVCATGYDTTHPLRGLSVAGQDGRLLADAWLSGPRAYLGITVPAFPNFFLMLGPNTLTGHTSALLSLEAQVAHAIVCMRRVRAEGRQWIAVKAAAARAQEAAVQQYLTTSVWSRCNSWYRTERGRIVAIWPGFARDYALAAREVDENAYELR